MSDRPQAPRLHHWVIIHQDAFHHTFRMRVPGGWLYRYQTTSPIVMAMESYPIDGLVRSVYQQARPTGGGRLLTH